MLFLPFAATTPAGPPTLDRRANPKPATPYAFTRLWTGIIKVGPSLSPIPIPGGVRIVTPVISGTITGPALNGTVHGGIEYVEVYDSGATQVPNVLSYGTTSDGTPYLIRETGAGDQVSTIIEIGGKYAALAKEFIVSEAKLSDDRTVVVTNGYKIEDR
ncbi:MAG: hypothetical protein Q9167_001763 [Letrouitia subvulpina]